ncbi:vegetative cell wall protein gp1 [Colletotrichum nymphaeae SA-01]|uniref:Vegetative cell wall protein gp1 n=1 Tax=Colletotrichum nymphaeae SA-01 TaxID=1460502 RepID=A0A135USW1_9PEZI|nr:vegetative cell wall protein gp1 [Colletotrichum nymphaeae SA-01]
MGWFDRKKAVKHGPEPVKPMPVNNHHQNINPSQYHAPPHPPTQQSSRYATSTTQTPPYWQPQPGSQGQYQHPPPPYRHPQPQHPHQQQQPHRPQGWSQQYPQQQQPIVVNQHYYLHPPPSHLVLPAPPGATGPPTTSTATGHPIGLDKFTGSVVTIAKDFTSPNFLEEPNFHPHATQLINSTAACVDQIAGCFNDVMTLIDRDRMVGNEKALFTYQNGGDGSGAVQQSTSSGDGKRSGGSGGRGEKSGQRKKSKETSSSGSKGQSAAVATCVVSGGYFAKVELYANSKLPMNLPPLRL